MVVRVMEFSKLILCSWYYFPIGCTERYVKELRPRFCYHGSTISSEIADGTVEVDVL